MISSVKIPAAKLATPKTEMLPVAPESFPVAATTGPVALNCPVVTSIAPSSRTVKVPCWFVNVTISTNVATVPEMPVGVMLPAIVP